MKGSIVYNSWKSIAARLHPQLPLSQKESQRLLTALTTSFRTALDEVHPPVNGGEHGGRSTSASPQTSERGVRSSAALADKHLASLLTNPLLSRSSTLGPKARPPPDVAEELAKNPHQDPISALERLPGANIATTSIARCCLDHMEKSLVELSPEATDQLLRQKMPGKRTLLWLWRNKLHETADFVDDSAVVKPLVHFLLREGHEELLWDWLKLDIMLTVRRHELPEHKKKHHQYRWKGRILGAMVEHKLNMHPTANAAIDVFVKAAQLKHSSSSLDSLRFLPLVHAVIPLQNALMRSDAGTRRRIDPEKYDQLLGALRKVPVETGGSHWRVALMSLSHPTQPSVWPFYRYLREAGSGEKSWLSRAISHGPAELQKFKFHKLLYIAMAQAAVLLEEEGAHSESQWVQALIYELFPDDVAKNTEENLRRGREGTWRVWDRSMELRFVENGGKAARSSWPAVVSPHPSIFSYPTVE